MIDYISVKIPLLNIDCPNLIEHPSFINDLSSMRTWGFRQLIPVKNHMTSCYMNVGVINGCLWLDGNPLKFLQGHNLFGSDDLRGLLFASIDTLQAIKHIFHEDDVPKIKQHAIQFGTLTRIDLTKMIDVGDENVASNFIKACRHGGYLKNRQLPDIDGQTIVFGKHSKASSLKIYPKHDEFIKGFHPQDVRLVDYSFGTIRFEAVYRSSALKKYGISQVAVWDENTADFWWDWRMKKLTISTNNPLSDEVRKQLPKALQKTYALWKSGENSKTIVSLPTFYKHRKALLPYGIDIATGYCRDDEKEGAMTTESVLASPTMAVPEWAKGTSYFFNAKSYRSEPCSEAA